MTVKKFTNITLDNNYNNYHYYYYCYHYFIIIIIIIPIFQEHYTHIKLEMVVFNTKLINAMILKASLSLDLFLYTIKTF